MSEPNPKLLGITVADYQAWRHHPATKLLLQYMADFKAVLEREAVQRWKQGSITLSDEHEMRARILTLAELGELPFEAIESFYQPESEQRAAETD